MRKKHTLCREEFKKIMVVFAGAALLAWGCLLPVSGAVTAPQTPADTGKTQAQLNGYSQEDWNRLMDNTLEYGEITDLVKNFNPDISSAWSSYQQNVANLTQAIETLQSARREMEGASSQAKGEGEIMDAMIYRGQAKGLGMVIESIGRTRDKLNRGDASSKARLYTAQDQVVQGVKQLMIGYKTLEVQEKTLQSLIALYESALRAADASLGAGTGTQADRQGAAASLADARAKLASLTASKAQLYQNLIVLCGWQPQAQVIIGELPEITPEEAALFSPQADLQAAIGNNYTLIENRRDSRSKSSTALEAKARKAEQDENLLRVNLEELHTKILTAQNTLKAAQMDVETARQLDAGIEVQNRVGMLSRNQYLGAKLDGIQKEAALHAAKAELLQAVENYQAAVAGNSPLE